MDRHSFIQSKQGVITQTMDDSLNTRQMYNNNNSNNDGDISVAITNGSPICISNPFTLSSSFSLEEEKRKHLPKALSISNHTVNQFDHVGANTTTTVVVVNEPTASSSSSVATSIKRVRSPNPFASKPVISPSSNPFYKPVAPIDLFYQFNSSPKTESMDNHHNGKSIHHPSLLNKPFSNSINNNNNNISKLSRNDSDVSVSNTLPFTINPLSADAISDQSFPRTTKKQRSIPSVPHQVNGTGTEIRPQEALFPFYVCASYGERKTMEDRYSVVGCLGNDPFASLYCVFDGHGGRTAADFCREYMHRHIVQAVNKHKVAAGSETKSIVDFVPTKQSLKDSFVSLDEAFKDTDASPYVGSTALVLLTRENRFWIAHVGDSKALLVRSDGSSEFLTEDHKPSNPIEKARIETCGGRISDNRIEGILAMSRAIGDKIFKGYVTAEPDVNEHELVKAGIHSSIAINATQQTQVFDYAIILGSDGLWDALSPQDAADIVRNAPNLHCANALVAKALESRKNSGASYSHDNVTALVVDLTRMNQERSPIGSTSQGSGPCSPLTSDLNATTQTLLHSSLGSPLALLSPNSTLSSIPGNRHPIFNNIEGNNFTLAFEQSENSSFTASSKPLYQKSVDVNVTQPSQINHVLFQNIISKETNSKMYDISPIIDQSATTISVQNSLNQTDLQDPSINSVPLHMQTESSTLLSSEATSSRVRKQRPKLTIDVRNEDGEIPGAAGGLGS